MNIGISRCLLGEKVRYDGGHKLDHFLTDVLGKYVTWVGVCPEVECGLPVPREAMHLEGTIGNVHLVSIRSGTDHTNTMLTWTEQRLNELNYSNLRGFVFKSKSPSSGMERIKLYPGNGKAPASNGVGIFAEQFMKKFPILPVEDEGRLKDAALRENFIERIFAFDRWMNLRESRPNVNSLVAFQTDHKLLIMAHSPKLLKTLGALVASANHKNLPTTLDSYGELLMEALKLIATVKKNVNVLDHIAGYFKNKLAPDEKKELHELIDQYHTLQVPLLVPLTMLRHYVRKYQEPYLMRQFYLHPHPLELMLRNHV